MLESNAQKASDEQNAVLGAIPAKADYKPAGFGVDEGDAHGVDESEDQAQDEDKPSQHKYDCSNNLDAGNGTCGD